MVPPVPMAATNGSPTLQCPTRFPGRSSPDGPAGWPDCHTDWQARHRRSPRPTARRLLTAGATGSVRVGGFSSVRLSTLTTVRASSRDWDAESVHLPSGASTRRDCRVSWIRCGRRLALIQRPNSARGWGAPRIKTAESFRGDFHGWCCDVRPWRRPGSGPAPELSILQPTDAVIR